MADDDLADLPAVSELADTDADSSACPPTPLPLPLARSTYPRSSLRYRKVRSTQRVSSLAVRLTGLRCQRTRATKRVDSHRYRVEMRRVDARPDAAKVIECHAGGDDAEHEFIGHPMRGDLCPIRAAKLSVALNGLRHGARPKPTTAWPVLVHLGPESFGLRKPGANAGWRCCLRRTQPVPPSVVLATPSPDVRTHRTSCNRACGHNRSYMTPEGAW